MNIETKTDKIHINQLVASKQENFEVESDVIIPDVKPDVLKIINTNGNICIYKKEILDNKVKIDGSINANIIYLADDSQGSVRAINTNIDFTKMIEVKNISSDMMLESDNSLNNVECKIINGRKIALKSNLFFEVKIFSNEEVSLIESIENLNDLQTLNKNCKVNSLIGHGNAKSIAKETINIDEIDNLAEIMKVKIDIINIEKKISYNKVLAKADVDVNILYSTEDNRVNMVKCRIPVMGFIDIQNINDENICDIKAELKNLLIKPNNVDEHSIYVEAEVEFSCLVYEEKNIELIQDMYSPSIDLKCNAKKVNVLQESCNIQEKCTVKEKQNIPEIAKGKINDVDINAYVRKKNFLNDRIIIEGEVKVKIIYSAENGLDMKETIIPFSHNVNCTDISSKSDLNIKFEVDNKDILIMPDESLDIKIDFNVLVNVVKKSEINIISNIESEENENRENYSMVIYFVKPGDTLWEIAKKFRSTVGEIAKINNIENEDKIYAGSQLFIPKYVANKSVESTL